MTRSRYAVLAGLLFVLTTLGCASAGEGGAERAHPNRITLAEIQASSATNAHELVQALRPAWLRPRGGSVREQEGELLVYLNRARLGPVSELLNVDLGGLTALEFVDGRTATQRWGTGHVGGVIVLHTGTER